MKPLLNTLAGVFNLLIITPFTLPYAVYVLISLVQVNRLARMVVMLFIFANALAVNYLLYTPDITVWGYEVIYLSATTNALAIIGAMIKERRLNASN